MITLNPMLVHEVTPAISKKISAKDGLGFWKQAHELYLIGPEFR